MTELYAILIALNIADVYLTLRILKAGGTERNPVMRELMARFGNTEALIGSKVIALGALYLALPMLHWGVLVGLIAVYVWVVWNNWRQT